MPFGIGLQKMARFIQRYVFADTGHHIMELAPFDTMIKHVIDGKQRHTGITGNF